MVLIMTQSWIPFGKQKEAADVYFKALDKYPVDKSLEKPILPLAVQTSQNGFHCISITEAKKGKVTELFNRVTEEMLLFTVIEGYRYQIDVLSSGAEALKTLGMVMPEIV